MIVVDATVAIKLLTREPGADEALARLVTEPDRLAPDWIRLEVANALTRKVRDAQLHVDAARAGMDGLSTIITDETATLDLLHEAFAISIELQHAVYDCLYLALARRHDVVVVTHDQKFVSAAQAAGCGGEVELLV